MVVKLSSLICRYLINKRIIDTADVELYTYGFFLLFSDILFSSIIILFGLLFNCILEIIIFYILFRTIRVFAGGYHANSETRCEILTTTSFLLVSYIISISENYVIETIVLGITVFAILAIALFAPLDTPAKPLDTDEKKKYRKISLLILSIIVLIIIVSIIFKIKLLFVPCCLSLILESILLVAGVIKGRLVNGS